MNPLLPSQPGPVDDVRAVREQIAAQHAGNLQEHRLETNRLFESLRAQLKLRLISPPPPAPVHRARGGTG